jgi:hypothetical protein
MDQQERHDKLWQAACAALTGLRANPNDDTGSVPTARQALYDAAALVAEYEKRTQEQSK